MVSVNIKLNPAGIALLVLLSLLILWYKFGFPIHFKDDTHVDMRELLIVSIDLAEKAGKQVVKLRKSKTAADLNIQSKGLTNMGKNDLVTDGDMLSHLTITQGFQSLYGNSITIKSEERNNRSNLKIDAVFPVKYKSEIFNGIPADVSTKILKSDITIWVDPLDATQEYTEDLTQYVSVMICVAVKGESQIGVIHFPFIQRTIWAYSGHTQSGINPVRVLPAEKSFIISRSHPGKTINETLSKKFGDVKIIAAGGAGYKIVQVLDGKVSAYIHTEKIKKWDICAGDAIIRAAKGRMTQIKNNDDAIDYSKDSSVVNDKGLLVTIQEHGNILQSLEDS